MKILHLSTGDSKGAFYGAYRTHTNLKKYNHDSVMCVLDKTSNDPDVIELSQTKRKIFSFINKLLRRLIVNRDINEDKTYLIYNTTFSVNDIFKKYTQKPDLIIVYYVADFLSDKDLHKIQRYYQCPIAFYLMDAGMITGGCHYPWQCEGFKSECKNCPAMLYPKLIKMPQRVLNNRKKYYSEMDCFYLSASKWLDERCSMSAIKARHGMKKALIGIDETIFTPRPAHIASKHLGISIPEKNRVIFLGAQSLNDPRKGVKYVQQSLEYIKKTYPELLQNVTILTVGAQSQNMIVEDVSLVNIDFIHDKTKYPYLYNIADGFICSSVEDAGPMMINEALMSGTPVISFKIGVAEDLIINGENGFLADNISANALADAIVNFLKISVSELTVMKNSSRNGAQKKCSSLSQVEAIESLLTGTLN
ncbi:glycosyl transferase family 1 [Enterobacter cloacae]|nr:glycosyl transferase family 1 [Enterobacter cloacae]